MTRYHFVIVNLLSIALLGQASEFRSALAQGPQGESLSIKVVTSEKNVTLESWLQGALAKSQTAGVNQVRITSVKVDMQGKITVLGVIPESLAADRAPLQAEIEQQFALGARTNLIVWADADNNPLPQPVADVTGMTTGTGAKPGKPDDQGSDTGKPSGDPAGSATGAGKPTPRGPTPKDAATEKPSTTPGSEGNNDVVTIMTQDVTNKDYVPEPLKSYVVRSLLGAMENTGYDDKTNKIESIDVYADGRVVLKGKLASIEARNKIGDSVKTLLGNAIAGGTIDWKEKKVAGEPRIDNQMTLPIAKRPLLAVLQGVRPQDVTVSTIDIRGNVVLVRGSSLDSNRVKDFQKEAGELLRQLYDLNGLEESFSDVPSLDVSGIEVSSIELESGLLNPKAKARGITLSRWYWSGGKSQYLHLVGSAPNIESRTEYAKEVETILRNAMAEGRFAKVGAATLFVVVSEILLPGQTPGNSSGPTPRSASGGSTSSGATWASPGTCVPVVMPAELPVRAPCGRVRRCGVR